MARHRSLTSSINGSRRGWLPGCIITALALTMSSLGAQRPEAPLLEARPFAGLYIPTGAQREVFANTPLVGLQGAVHLPTVILTSTFNWGRSGDRRAGATHDIDLYQIDWGLEKEPLASPLRWQLRPFLGAGLGLRIYDSREPGATTRRAIAGFATGGLSRRVGRVDTRVEIRDHLSGYRGVTVVRPSSVRNDLTVAIGIARGFR